MRLLISISKAFAGALIGVLAAMYALSLFVPHRFHLWPGVGMASGIAIGAGIRSQWSFSPTAGAVLVGVLAGTGNAVGIWLSVHF
jgi:hypothetical protein